jgi:V-type H+-transporting ATPase subunit H
VQYILALLLQMLQANPGRAQLFHARPPASDPYPILLRLLQRSDWFTQDKACQLLVRVLQARPHKDATLPSHASSGQANGAAPSSSNGASSSSSHGVAPADPAEACTVSLVDWLCSQLRRYQVAPSSGSGGASGGSSSSSSSAPAVPRQVVSAMSALAVLLREKRVRAIFTQAGGVGLLAPLLRAAAGPTSSQLAYEICLCLWQLSFYEPAVAAMGAAGGCARAWFWFSRALACACVWGSAVWGLAV